MQDFDDLNDLVKESVQLAAAKKAKAQGRKLKSGQEVVLATMRSFEERALWETKVIYTHVVIVECLCGEWHKEFRGWYHYQETRIGTGRRLERHIQPAHEATPEFPVKVFSSQEAVSHCPSCLNWAAMEHAILEDCDILFELMQKPKPVEAIPTTHSSSATPIIEDFEDVYGDELTELNSDEPQE